jgi:hypothetical protein
MDCTAAHQPSARHRHDPLQRLIRDHAQEVLDIARASTRHPDAIAAHAISIDVTGVTLIIETADGRETIAHVQFAQPATGARRRLAFLSLAVRSAQVLGDGRSKATVS